MRLGQIGCGRYNPPIQSAELPSRIGMAKGMPSTSLQDWKAATAPLLPQKRRWYDTGGLLYRSACTKQPRYAHGCLYPSRWFPWLQRCPQRTQVYLKLMIIRVNLQFLYRRLNQYKTKLSELDIFKKLLISKRKSLTVSSELYHCSSIPTYRSAANDSGWTVVSFPIIIGVQEIGQPLIVPIQQCFYLTAKYLSASQDMPISKNCCLLSFMKDMSALCLWSVLLLFLLTSLTSLTLSA
ncbi:Hypothetical_protein [Hexamita inflata]|uniref:Hypothetical_protein n=1 Tax=Hexamita inflata TaxID=28002 RepID=A0AA86NQM4_9EUKA|nr:Hypothetical protein HINF_LOCUS11875 [Hexamita inflata]